MGWFGSLLCSKKALGTLKSSTTQIFKILHYPETKKQKQKQKQKTYKIQVNWGSVSKYLQLTTLGATLKPNLRLTGGSPSSGRLSLFRTIETSWKLQTGRNAGQPAVGFWSCPLEIFYNTMITFLKVNNKQGNECVLCVYDPKNMCYILKRHFWCMTTVNTNCTKIADTYSFNDLMQGCPT